MDEIGGDLEDYDENQEKTATALNQMKREVEEYNKLASSVDAIAISNLKLSMTHPLTNSLTSNYCI